MKYINELIISKSVYFFLCIIIYDFLKNFLDNTENQRNDFQYFWDSNSKWEDDDTSNGGDYFYININDERVKAQYHVKKFSMLGSQCGSSLSWDGEYNIHITKRINTPTLKIYISTNLNNSADDESWAFNEFKLYFYTCYFTCSSCDGDLETNCITCDIDKNFVKNTSTNLCECFLGFFLFNQNCIKCHQSCQKCSDIHETNCTQCDPILNKILFDGKCICNSGYYLLDNICYQCTNGCQTCQSSTKCNLCLSNTNRIFDSVNNTCYCDNYYYYNPVTMNDFICQKCHYSCIQCTGNLANNCTKCESSLKRILNEFNQCNCMSGYIEESSVCIPCKLPCLECAGKVNLCTSCVHGLYIFNDTCYPCDSICKECKNLAGFCTLCKDEQNRELDIISNTCVCKPQYYYDKNTMTDLICIKCHYSCFSCNETTYNNCTGCDNSKNRQIDKGKCLCKLGFVEVGYSGYMY
ncbi:hypothetical protein IMG5_202700 [Ichthyophthirius multifiliis]|uniref:EGF-like domain-containing protein n=1 Tax=Ichthyophthirius multifiliis TaxID=5932 RepID=G0R668_ICHMU|nr:hypothetical protein IMG5_202700 [Ichthyophthirius multifiliis]EGR27032.1 hypothetical protein IMG5_202700 [Ichthyophthirius multifiliis]|eukprot:XP_004023916.1 hypothetical protein IMG5_202700 [Ichthyophthirius multifiliis]